MISFCFAMIPATRPTSVHEFIVFVVGLGIICKHEFLAFVQWWSQRAHRAFFHYLFKSYLRGNRMDPLDLQLFSQRAPLSFTHLLLFLCLVNMFSVNVWIPCVWQRWLFRAKRALMHLLFFLWVSMAGLQWIRQSYHGKSHKGSKGECCLSRAHVPW